MYASHTTPEPMPMRWAGAVLTAGGVLIDLTTATGRRIIRILYRPRKRGSPATRIDKRHDHPYAATPETAGLAVAGVTAEGDGHQPGRHPTRPNRPLEVFMQSLSDRILVDTFGDDVDSHGAVGRTGRESHKPLRRTSREHTPTSTSE